MKIKKKDLFKYRALYAEWEVAYLKVQLLDLLLSIERQKEEYKELFNLFDRHNEAQKKLGLAGKELMSAQKDLANVLGITVKDFTDKYKVDFDKGVVEDK